MFANRSHVKYEFINMKKLVKKLARIEASSVVANSLPKCLPTVIVPFTHINLSCRHEFANFSFPCEGCLIRRVV